MTVRLRWNPACKSPVSLDQEFTTEEEAELVVRAVLPGAVIGAWCDEASPSLEKYRPIWEREGGPVEPLAAKIIRSTSTTHLPEALNDYAQPLAGQSGSPQAEPPPSKREYAAQSGIFDRTTLPEVLEISSRKYR